MLYSNWRNIPVFSAEWFKLWQKSLLFVVNCVPVLGRDLRQALGIPDDYDKAIITNLYIDCFHCYNGYRKRVAVFYSRQPLADSLRKNWKELWSLLHSWDVNYANKYLPCFNVGFDTLTQNPQTGSGGSNITCDGWGKYYAASPGVEYYDMPPNNPNFTVSYLQAARTIGSSDPLYTAFYTSIMGFNTSSIGSASTVNTITLSLRVTAYTIGTVYIRRAYPASFSNPSNDSFGISIYEAGNEISMYRGAYTLPYTYANIITSTGCNQTGVTAYKTKPNFDTWSTANCTFYSSDNGSYKPALEVIYTLPSTGRKISIMEG